MSLGQTFSVGVGEQVTISAADISVTYASLVSDSRCRPGQQCIVAGEATIAVTVTVTGSPPTNLHLTTDGTATSGRYGSYTIELVRLGFGRPPTATLRVT